MALTSQGFGSGDGFAGSSSGLGLWVTGRDQKAIIEDFDDIGKDFSEHDYEKFY